MVNQADDDVPHDRTPLFDQRALVVDLGFRISSRARKTASSVWPTVSCLLGPAKSVHGTEIGGGRTMREPKRTSGVPGVMAEQVKVLRGLIVAP